MLWSMAGNLAMVHRVFMGMHFETDGIHFAPVIPHTYPGKKKLANFTYREAHLTISVNGTGNKIAAVLIDGKKSDRAFIPATITGMHTLEIEMDNQPFPGSSINTVTNYFTLPEPQVKINKATLEWEIVEGAVAYTVYKDGKKYETIHHTGFTITDSSAAEFNVTAIDKNGIGSFTSEPVLIVKEQNVQKLEMEKFGGVTNHPYVNFSGTGFTEIATDKNKGIAFSYNADEAGDYLVDFRYSNGSGPWNTDNKCALRSLYTNGNYTGTVVFPQRGKNEWSDWGFSNSYKVNLKKGKNNFKLVFEDWNNNMNVEINTAMLDYVRIIRL
jgi:hypothetical protein